MAKKVLMIIAPSDFRDEELFVTREELEKAGFEITLASSSVGEAVGMLGGEASVDVDFEHIDVLDFDAVVFVGGSGASEFFLDPAVLGIAKRAAKKGMIIASICIAGSILANAGALKGRKATCFSSEKANLESKGAVYTNEGVTIDDNIVTASGPKYAREFGKAIVKALESRK